MKIGFLAPGSPMAVAAYSGVPFFAFRALKAIAPDSFYLDAGGLDFKPWHLKANRISNRLIGKTVLVHPGQVSRRKPFQLIDAAVKQEKPDAIICLNTDFHVPTHVDVPIILHSDATLGAIVNYYPMYADVFGPTLRHGFRTTLKAYNAARFCAFASGWAAESAISDHKQSPDKVSVIEYGANLLEPPARSDVANRHISKTCQFLFIGREWERKGGSTAFETMLRLLEQGFDVSMVAVGCTPDVSHPRLRCVPFLNKQDPEDAALYDQLWRESHILFQPSHQETFGAIYAEAAANAMPVIAQRTGGVPYAVEDGVTGVLLEPTASIEEYCNVVKRFCESPEFYKKISENARAKFETTLNWDTWAAKIYALAERAVAEKAKTS